MIKPSANVRTANGEMPVYLYCPDGDEPRPVVLYLMDAIGIRREFLDFAQRLSGAGYYVMAPDLYYRTPHEQELDLNKPEQRDTIMALYGSLTHAQVSVDATALLDVAGRDARADVTRAGVVGYCMSGTFALSVAAAEPERIKAVASIHPGHFVTGQADSPHRHVARIGAEVYMAVADQDPFATPEQVETLRVALKQAGVRHRIELYSGAMHGFSFPSLPSYDAAASERHWQALLQLLDRVL